MDVVELKLEGIGLALIGTLAVMMQANWLMEKWKLALGAFLAPAQPTTPHGLASSSLGSAMRRHWNSLCLCKWHL